MKNKIHGLISVLFFFVSTIIGTVAIMRFSLLFAIFYIIISLFSFMIVLYSYCSKCVSRNDCGHVIPGLITKILPKRKDGKYTTLDVFGIIFFMLVIIVLPQYWLIKTIPLLITFWALLIICGIEISLFVCKKCNNINCYLCPNKEK